MNHLKWEKTPAFIGPETYYGFWDGAKCFSVFWGADTTSYSGLKYVLKCNLPGFRLDLPRQETVAAAQEFAEKMLTRWVAKRGLLFKANIIVTDAMEAAGIAAAPMGSLHDNPGSVKIIIEAALEAREAKPA